MGKGHMWEWMGYDVCGFVWIWGSDRATRRYEIMCLRCFFCIVMVSHTLWARPGPTWDHTGPNGPIWSHMELWARQSISFCPPDVWAHLGPYEANKFRLCYQDECNVIRTREREKDAYQDERKARARVGAQSGLGPGPGWGPYGPIGALMGP